MCLTGAMSILESHPNSGTKMHYKHNHWNIWTQKTKPKKEKKKEIVDS